MTNDDRTRATVTLTRLRAVGLVASAGVALGFACGPSTRGVAEPSAGADAMESGPPGSRVTSDSLAGKTCEQLAALYRSAIDTTPCAADAECSEPRTADLFCFAGPNLVNPRSERGRLLRHVERAFEARCSAMPCTPTNQAYVTRCQQGACVTTPKAR